MKNSKEADSMNDVKVDVCYTRWGKRTVLCMITLEDGQEFVGSSYWSGVDDFRYEEETEMRRLAHERAELKARDYVCRGSLDR